jgi:poly(A) polymerase
VPIEELASHPEEPIPAAIPDLRAEDVPPDAPPSHAAAIAAHAETIHAGPVDRFIHRDNTFGTPEEDAFRRDFTINALFYDIATFSVIDYVGGLEDLRAGIVRSIGDPDERFQEDPVRMQRAVALASRLGFQIEPRIYEAIARRRTELSRSAPPRLLEEYYKILRGGCSAPTFQALEEVGLLRPVSKELHHGADDRLWRSLAALDLYRRRFDEIPPALTNPILLGSLAVPLGLWPPPRHDAAAWRDPRIQLGALPVARRDVERLRQIISLQNRLLDIDRSPRTMAALVHRSAFREALTWLEIHGDAPDAVAHWKGFLHATEATEPHVDHRPARRRRRRRRRRFNVE